MEISKPSTIISINKKNYNNQKINTTNNFNNNKINSKEEVICPELEIKREKILKAKKIQEISDNLYQNVKKINLNQDITNSKLTYKNSKYKAYLNYNFNKNSSNKNVLTKETYSNIESKKIKLKSIDKTNNSNSSNSNSGNNNMNIKALVNINSYKSTKTDERNSNISYRGYKHRRIRSSFIDDNNKLLDVIVLTNNNNDNNNIKNCNQKIQNIKNNKTSRNKIEIISKKSKGNKKLVVNEEKENQNQNQYPNQTTNTSFFTDKKNVNNSNYVTLGTSSNNHNVDLPNTCSSFKKNHENNKIESEGNSKLFKIAEESVGEVNNKKEANFIKTQAQGRDSFLSHFSNSVFQKEGNGKGNEKFVYNHTISNDRVKRENLTISNQKQTKNRFKINRNGFSSINDKEKSLTQNTVSNDDKKIKLYPNSIKVMQSYRFISTKNNNNNNINNISLRSNSKKHKNKINNNNHTQKGSIGPIKNVIKEIKNFKDSNKTLMNEIEKKLSEIKKNQKTNNLKSNSGYEKSKNKKSKEKNKFKNNERHKSKDKKKENNDNNNPKNRKTKTEFNVRQTLLNKNVINIGQCNLILNDTNAKSLNEKIYLNKSDDIIDNPRQSFTYNEIFSNKRQPNKRQWFMQISNYNSNPNPAEKNKEGKNYKEKRYVYITQDNTFITDDEGENNSTKSRILKNIDDQNQEERVSYTKTIYRNKDINKEQFKEKYLINDSKNNTKSIYAHSKLNDKKIIYSSSLSKDLPKSKEQEKIARKIYKNNICYKTKKNFNHIPGKEQTQEQEQLKKKEQLSLQNSYGKIIVKNHSSTYMRNKTDSKKKNYNTYIYPDNKKKEINLKKKNDDNNESDQESFCKKKQYINAVFDSNNNSKKIIKKEDIFDNSTRPKSKIESCIISFQKNKPNETYDNIFIRNINSFENNKSNLSFNNYIQKTPDKIYQPIKVNTFNIRTKENDFEKCIGITYFKPSKERKNNLLKNSLTIQHSKKVIAEKKNFFDLNLEEIDTNNNNLNNQDLNNPNYNKLIKDKIKSSMFCNIYKVNCVTPNSSKVDIFKNFLFNKPEFSIFKTDNNNQIGEFHEKPNVYSPSIYHRKSLKRQFSTTGTFDSRNIQLMDFKYENNTVCKCDELTFEKNKKMKTYYNFFSSDRFKHNFHKKNKVFDKVNEFDRSINDNNSKNNSKIDRDEITKEKGNEKEKNKNIIKNKNDYNNIYNNKHINKENDDPNLEIFKGNQTATYFYSNGDKTKYSNMTLRVNNTNIYKKNDISMEHENTINYETLRPYLSVRGSAYQQSLITNIIYKNKAARLNKSNKINQVKRMTIINIPGCFIYKYYNYFIKLPFKNGGYFSKNFIKTLKLPSSLNCKLTKCFVEINKNSILTNSNDDKIEKTENPTSNLYNICCISPSDRTEQKQNKIIMISEESNYNNSISEKNIEQIKEEAKVSKLKLKNLKNQNTSLVNEKGKENENKSVQNYTILSDSLADNEENINENKNDELMNGLNNGKLMEVNNLENKEEPSNNPLTFSREINEENLFLISQDLSDNISNFIIKENSFEKDINKEIIKDYTIENGNTPINKKKGGKIPESRNREEERGKEEEIEDRGEDEKTNQNNMEIEEDFKKIEQYKDSEYQPSGSKLFLEADTNEMNCIYIDGEKNGKLDRREKTNSNYKKSIKNNESNINSFNSPIKVINSNEKYYFSTLKKSKNDDSKEIKIFSTEKEDENPSESRTIIERFDNYITNNKKSNIQFSLSDKKEPLSEGNNRNSFGISKKQLQNNILKTFTKQMTISFSLERSNLSKSKLQKNEKTERTYKRMKPEKINKSKLCYGHKAYKNRFRGQNLNLFFETSIKKDFTSLLNDNKKAKEQNEIEITEINNIINKAENKSKSWIKPNNNKDLLLLINKDQNKDKDKNKNKNKSIATEPFVCISPNRERKFKRKKENRVQNENINVDLLKRKLSEISFGNECFPSFRDPKYSFLHDEYSDDNSLYHKKSNTNINIVSTFDIIDEGFNDGKKKNLIKEEIIEEESENYLEQLKNEICKNKLKHEMIYVLNISSIYNKLTVVNELFQLIIKNIYKDNGLNPEEIVENGNLFFELIIGRILLEKKYVNLYIKIYIDIYNQLIDYVYRINMENEKNNNFKKKLDKFLLDKCQLIIKEFFNSSFQKDVTDKSITENKFYLISKTKSMNFLTFISGLADYGLLNSKLSGYFLEQIDYYNLDFKDENTIPYLYIEIAVNFFLLFGKRIYESTDLKNLKILNSFINDKLAKINEQKNLRLPIPLKFKIINLLAKHKNNWEGTFIIKRRKNINKKEKKSNEEERKEIDNSMISEGSQKNSSKKKKSKKKLFKKNQEDSIDNNNNNNITKSNNLKDEIFFIVKKDLENYSFFIKSNIDSNSSFSDVNEKYDWSLTEKLIIEDNIELDEIICCFVEICIDIITSKDMIIISNEYIKNIINSFPINISVNEYELLHNKIVDLFLNIKNICIDNQYMYEIMGFLLYILIKNKLFFIKDINIFITKDKQTQTDITKVVKYTILSSGKQNKKYIKDFKKSELFKNNQIFSEYTKEIENK